MSIDINIDVHTHPRHWSMDEREIAGLVTMDVTKQDSIPHVSDSFGTSGPQSSVSVTEKLIVAMPSDIWSVVYILNPL